MAAATQKIKTFYHNQVEQALEACQVAGYQPLFMPQLADGRMNGTQPWNQWRSAPSIRATGRTQQGNAVVVYAHIPNWLANPANIRAAKEKGLVNYAARIPQEEFQRLVDAEDKQRVWVIDHDALRKSTSGRINITDAIKHPQVIPFLGGQERAEHYLSAHAQAYNTRIIGVWHTDDLHDGSPLARLLYLGDLVSFGLNGDFFLYYSGQFSGVRQRSAEGARSEKTTAATVITPTLEEMLNLMTDLVPQFAQDELRARLRKLYGP